MEELMYPIGRFALGDELTSEDRTTLIDQIAQMPTSMRGALSGLTDDQLDTRYREEGWTLRQVVHHVADSHIGGYVRFKWAATEQNPMIKPYGEPEWAELADGKSAPIDISLDLLDTLHARWVLYLRSLGPDDFLRPVRHPEWGEWTVDNVLGLYAWHGLHHVAHVTELRDRKGW